MLSSSCTFFGVPCHPHLTLYQGYGFRVFAFSLLSPASLPYLPARLICPHHDTRFTCLPACQGTWLELNLPRLPTSPHEPKLGPNASFHVSPRSVSGARWSSEVKQLKHTGDSDTDYDFDAVLVDDTDLNVPDDVWDSTAKTADNSSVNEEVVEQD
ncbi:hypothetical protein AHF37_01085 [Paragonimus kellicotti]|nr:hypothetical protein AHF37_01084 [Paragonimus kellicotti]KAF6780163.1 hypothetical protein AHF37_01085 [Paragonimus kellicotti]